MTGKIAGNIVVSGGPSLQFVPDTPTTALLLEGALFGQRPEVLLQGVATRAGQPDRRRPS